MTSCDLKLLGASRYIRVEICYKCYRWHCTDSMFLWTVSEW